MRMAPTIKNMQPYGVPSVNRKPGRPRAIPPDFGPKIIHLYDMGLGYRAIARELRGEGLSVDWSTVRRLVKTIIAGRVEEKRA
jgi:hypothetical protein